MKVTFLFNELTVPLARVRASKPFRPDFLCPGFTPLFRSYYLLPRVRKNTMLPTDRKITSFLASAPSLGPSKPAGLRRARLEMGHDGF